MVQVVLRHTQGRRAVDPPRYTCEHAGVNSRVTSAGLVLTVSLVLAGCASSMASAPGRRLVAGASSPEAAAIGFYESSIAGEDLKFECLPGNDIRLFTAVVTGRPTASATRVAHGWAVN